MCYLECLRLASVNEIELNVSSGVVVNSKHVDSVLTSTDAQGGTMAPRCHLGFGSHDKTIALQWDCLWDSICIYRFHCHLSITHSVPQYISH